MSDILEAVSETAVIVIVSFVILAGVSVLMAFPISWCWNYVVPHISSLPRIGWATLGV